jgi:benzoate-CoA ligase
MSVGATTVLMAERPTPEATFRRWLGEVGGVKPTVFYGAPTGFAGMLAIPRLPARDAGGAAAGVVRRRGAAGRAWASASSAHFGVDIVDGIGSTEMLHIFLSNRPAQVRYGTTGWPVPGYDDRAARRGRRARWPTARPATCTSSGPVRRHDVLGQPRPRRRETFQGGWTKSGDKYVRDADGSYTYAGRSDDMLKVSGIYVSPVRGRSHAACSTRAVLEAAVIGVADAEGLIKTKAFVVLKARRRRPTSADAQGLREGAAGALQVPAPDRLRAPTCPRPPPARSSASSCASASGMRAVR